MVVAGLIIGDRGRAFAMSETTRRNLDLFWKLVDDFLSVASTIGALRVSRRFPAGSAWILTWGGLRGALAVAMALSVPPGPARPAQDVEGGLRARKRP